MSDLNTPTQAEIRLAEAERVRADVYVELHECMDAIDQMYIALAEIDKRAKAADTEVSCAMIALTRDMW